VHDDMYRRICDKRRRAARLDKRHNLCYTVSDTSEGGTMRFYTTSDTDENGPDDQTFCDPCSIRFIHRNPGTALYRMRDTEERCCDACGEYRDGTGAAQRNFA